MGLGGGSVATTRPFVTARKAFSCRGRAVTKTGTVVEENTEGTRATSPLELSWLVWFPSNVVTVLNIVGVWDEGFPSFCLCLFVVCTVSEGQKEARASFAGF